MIDFYHIYDRLSILTDYFGFHFIEKENFGYQLYLPSLGK
jgi:hypothetical protein